MYTETGRCPKCGEHKPLTSEFWHMNKGRKAGVSTYCKICNRTYNNIANHRRPERVMWRAAKARAKAAGVPFNIEPSDIEIPNECPALGVPLEQNLGKLGHGPNSPSLDRLVPELGYVKGNVIVISHRANAIKRDATLPELEAVTAFVRRAIKSLH